MDNQGQKDAGPRPRNLFQVVFLWLKRTFWPRWVSAWFFALWDETAPVMLAAGNYQGSFDPRRSNATNGGQSTYDGTMMVALLDRSLVKQVLAPGLDLAVCNLPGATVHPVILLLGKQYDLCYLINGTTVSANATPYTELILIVPFTVQPPGTKWHNFVVRMYLDNPEAIIIGDAIYAYAKLPGTFSTQGTTSTVQFNAGTVFQCDVTPGAAASVAPGATLPPGFAEIQKIFEMPMLGYFGVNPPAFLPGWRFSCSYFEWDYSNAFAAPADTTFTFVQGFTPNMSGWVSLGQLSNARSGAFSIMGLRWRLSLQLPLLPPNVPPACAFS